MRVHHFVLATVVLAVATLSAGSAFGHTDAPGWNNPVRITNASCDVGYTLVNAQYRTIVFGIFNNGTVAHGFDIGGPYISGLVKPGEEKTLVTHFGPGSYRYACVSRHSTVKRGVLTIR